MTSIAATASYVRKKTSSQHSSLTADVSVSGEDADRIWQLMSTPQTVETVRRRVSNDAKHAVDAQAITTLFFVWLKDELIEQAPDNT